MAKPETVTTPRDEGGRIYYVEAGKVYEGKKTATISLMVCRGCHFDDECRGEKSRVNACYYGRNGIRGNRTLHRVRPSDERTKLPMRSH